MICELFRATELLKLCKVDQIYSTYALQDDDVQDIDVRWDQALLAASEIPTEMILEGLYKSKLQDSVQLQIVLAMFEKENVRNFRTTKLFQIEDISKTSY